MKRFLPFLLLAFLPVIMIGYLFPDRALKDSTPEELYLSTHGGDIVVFVRDGCPHCAEFEEFAKEQGWAIEYHEVTDLGTQELFQRVQKVSPLLQQGVPTVVLNGKILQGYDTHETTGKFLTGLYEECKGTPKGCLSFETFLETGRNVPVTSASEGTCTGQCETDESKYLFNLWFIGPVNLLDFSLPALSIFLGFLDGFNPCALWVLITLLTLLINTHDMRKIWVIGGTFLFVSGVVYYLFIAAWLNAFLLIGYNVWVQKIIGLVAIGGGGFYLYEAFGKDPNACRVTDFSKRQRTIERMKAVLQISAWPAMIAGVAILAVSVNMIELVCTAGLPVIFTQILAFNDVSNVARYLYLLLYILMYMIDDLIIFGIAVYTLRATGLTTKYRRFTLIFGGLLMYILGLLLIFYPELLTFT